MGVVGAVWRGPSPSATSLTDDNFASIVTADEEGRSIDDDVKKFVRYLLAGNAGKLLGIAVPRGSLWEVPELVSGLQPEPGSTRAEARTPTPTANPNRLLETALIRPRLADSAAGRAVPVVKLGFDTGIEELDKYRKVIRNEALKAGWDECLAFQLAGQALSDAKMPVQEVR